MSSAEIKEDLHRHIEQMDERFLKVLHAMPHAYLEQSKEDKIDDEIENIPLSPWAQAYSKVELIADLNEANAQFDQWESTHWTH